MKRNYFNSASARHAVLAQVRDNFLATKDIAEKAGVSSQTVVNHLYAAEADGLVEMMEGVEPSPSFWWRRRKEQG